MVAPHRDPLGLALQEYMDGQRDVAVKTWSSIEGWDVLPMSRFFRAGAALPAVERAAMSAVGGRVLDLGAGAGCHALSLHRKGLEVVALDASRGACAAMRKRGLPKVFCGHWQSLHPDSPAEQRPWKGTAGFDTVVALMNGLGLAGRVAQLPTFLEAIGHHLAPGGQLLVDSADVQYMFMDPVFAGGEGLEGQAATQYMDLSKDHYGECNYRMVYKDHDSGLFPWVFLDFPALRKLAGQCGWKAEKLHEDRFFGYLARLEPKR